MKIALLLTSTLLISASAFANPELAEKKGCLACHAVDAKRIGPSFKDVAAKYAGDKKVVAALASKVRKGGGGVWGSIPMPANTQVSEAEAKQLVEWVLATK
ncbi:MAG: cytochrome C' [Burkholderiales bacterium PBB1]|nr:MAG: cytochrome C' [Burkholderiales bacterium PBB1]